jgi:hypothetical protein
MKSSRLFFLIALNICVAPNLVIAQLKHEDAAALFEGMSHLLLKLLVVSDHDTG